MGYGDLKEHVYDDDYDDECNVCDYVREVESEKPGEIVYGDANGDGKINNVDVALLQQFLAEVEVENFDEIAADANGDGKVNNVDVALLQQYLAEWDVTLGPKKIFNDAELGEW